MKHMRPTCPTTQHMQETQTPPYNMSLHPHKTPNMHNRNVHEQTTRGSTTLENQPAYYMDHNVQDEQTTPTPLNQTWEHEPGNPEYTDHIKETQLKCDNQHENKDMANTTPHAL